MLQVEALLKQSDRDFKVMGPLPETRQGIGNVSVDINRGTTALLISEALRMVLGGKEGS